MAETPNEIIERFRNSPAYVGGYIVRFAREPGLTKKGLLESPLWFPIPPTDGVRWSLGYDYSDYQTLGAGTFTRAAGRQLGQVAFATLVDWDNHEWSSWWYENPDPHEFTDTLKELLASGTPFRVHMGTPELNDVWDIAWTMTFREMSVEERSGEPDSRYVDCSLTQFRHADMNVRKKGRHKHDLPATFTVNKDSKASGGHVKAPVTLAKVSQHYYGSSQYARFIALASGIRGFAKNEPLGEYVTKRNRGRPVKVKVPAFHGRRPGPG